jgi:hypothetical protein
MAAHTGASKKKSPNADGIPRDGLTGMGFHTQKHFVEVKQKMNDYVGQQQDLEYDQMHQYPQEGRRHHLLDLGFLDGKRATKSLSLPSTTVKSDKQSAHHKLDSPKSDHRHRKPSPRASGAK